MSLEMYNPNAAPGEVVFTSLSGYNYTSLLEGERLYIAENYRNVRYGWMKTNWLKAIFISFIYVIVIFTGQHLMKSREKFSLKPILFIWNLLLAIFSIIGTIRVWPEFIYILKEHGFEYSICTETFTHGVTGFWSWLFVLSKVAELFDTIFIVLNKSPLIFLHWYHHVTVLDYCWYSIHEFPATGRWFATLNYGVHALMYSYYAIRSMGVKTLNIISLIITSLQIIQMIAGVYVNIIAYQIKQKGERSCDATYQNIYLALAMYFSYFILFFHFFYKRYIKKVPKRADTNVASKHDAPVKAKLQ